MGANSSNRTSGQMWVFWANYLFIVFVMYNEETRKAMNWSKSLLQASQIIGTPYNNHSFVSLGSTKTLQPLLQPILVSFLNLDYYHIVMCLPNPVEDKFLRNILYIYMIWYDLSVLTIIDFFQSLYVWTVKCELS